MDRIFGEFHADESTGATVIEVKYSDIAIGADEKFVADSKQAAGFSDISVLSKRGLTVKNRQNPIEYYSVALDGTASGLEEKNDGMWSNCLSDGDGYFDEEIEITFKADSEYWSNGLTFTFDDSNNIYSTDLSIEWRSNNDLVAKADFSPDSAVFFCEQKVEACDEIIVRFKRINAPYTRLRIRTVEYGYDKIFSGSEIKSISVSQKYDPTTTTLEINTVGLTIYDDDGREYSFDERQPVSIYHNGTLKQMSFISSAKRTGKCSWNVSTEDYIGLLENIKFNGGVYSEVRLFNLLEDIFKTAKVPYAVQSGVQNVLLSGYIPRTTCREALMQVLFAAGVSATTAEKPYVYIFEPQNETNSVIPSNCIMEGQTFEKQPRVTEVELYGHKYIHSYGKEDTLYENKDGTEQDELLVEFSDPIWLLEITDGEILEESHNHAVIKAGTECVLTGRKFEHVQFVKSKKNPKTLASDIENVKSIKTATLISENNIDKILNLCYNELTNNNTTSMSIAEREADIQYYTYGETTYGNVKYGINDGKTLVSVGVGDVISYETEYSGIKQGRITSQQYSLISNLIVKQINVKEMNI